MGDLSLVRASGLAAPACRARERRRRTRCHRAPRSGQSCQGAGVATGACHPGCKREKVSTPFRQCMARPKCAPTRRCAPSSSSATLAEIDGKPAIKLSRKAMYGQIVNVARNDFNRATGQLDGLLRRVRTMAEQQRRIMQVRQGAWLPVSCCGDPSRPDRTFRRQSLALAPGRWRGRLWARHVRSMRRSVHPIPE